MSKVKKNLTKKELEEIIRVKYNEIAGLHRVIEKQKSEINDIQSSYEKKLREAQTKVVDLRNELHTEIKTSASNGDKYFEMRNLQIQSLKKIDALKLEKESLTKAIIMIMRGVEND